MFSTRTTTYALGICLTAVHHHEFLLGLGCVMVFARVYIQIVTLTLTTLQTYVWMLVVMHVRQGVDTAMVSWMSYMVVGIRILYWPMSKPQRFHALYPYSILVHRLCSVFQVAIGCFHPEHAVVPLPLVHRGVGGARVPFGGFTVSHPS